MSGKFLKDACPWFGCLCCDGQAVFSLINYCGLCNLVTFHDLAQRIRPWSVVASARDNSNLSEYGCSSWLPAILFMISTLCNTVNGTKCRCDPWSAVLRREHCLKDTFRMFWCSGILLNFVVYRTSWFEVSSSTKNMLWSCCGRDVGPCHSSLLKFHQQRSWVLDIFSVIVLRE